MHNAEFFSNQGNLSFTTQKYTYGYIFMNQPIQLVLSDCIHSQKFCFSGDSGHRRLLDNFLPGLFNNILSIGDLPVGADVAVATRDKERNLSTRNQKVLNKELFGKRSGRNKYFFK